MKNKIILLVTFFLVTIALILLAFFFLPSKLEEKKMNLYVEYINSIVPNPNSENLNIVTGRKNFDRINNAIVTYYKACNDGDYNFVKDIINKEYVNYMNINLNELVRTNSKENIEASKIELNSIYDVGNNIYFATFTQNDNIYFVGMLLSEDSTKYSIIFDGYYNSDKLKEFERDFQIDE